MKNFALLCVGFGLLAAAACATPPKEDRLSSEYSEQESPTSAEVLSIPPEYADVLSGLETASAELSREGEYEDFTDPYSDPFSQKYGTVLSEVFWQRYHETSENLIAVYNAAHELRMENLTEQEKSSLYEAYVALVELVHTNRLEYHERTKDLDFGGESIRGELPTRGSVNELLCGWIDKSDSDWPIKCAAKLALVENFPSDEYWAPVDDRELREGELVLQAEIEEISGETLQLYLSEVIGARGLPPETTEALSLYCGASAAIIGWTGDTGEITFDAEVTSDFGCPAAAPPENFSAALLDLFDQLAIVSDSNDNNDYLRDGERKNFVLKEDLLYCRENSGEIYLFRQDL